MPQHRSRVLIKRSIANKRWEFQVFQGAQEVCSSGANINRKGDAERAILSFIRHCQSGKVRIWKQNARTGEETEIKLG